MNMTVEAAVPGAAEHGPLTRRALNKGLTKRVVLTWTRGMATAV